MKHLNKKTLKWIVLGGILLKGALLGTWYYQHKQMKKAKYQIEETKSFLEEGYHRRDSLTKLKEMYEK